MVVVREEFPITMVQVVIIRKKGKTEQLRSIDIPVRNSRLVDINLDSGDWGVDLQLSVPADPSYSVTYVIRDEQAAVDGKLPPYTDGIYSDTDVAGIKAGLEHQHAIKIDVLEKKIKRRDRTIRQLRREKRRGGADLMDDKERVWEHTCRVFKTPEIVALKEFILFCPHCGVVQPKKEG